MSGGCGRNTAPKARWHRRRRKAAEAAADGEGEKKIEASPRNRATSSLANQNKWYLTPRFLSPDVEITRTALFCPPPSYAGGGSDVAALPFVFRIEGLAFVFTHVGLTFFLFSLAPSTAPAPAGRVWAHVQ